MVAVAYDGVDACNKIQEYRPDIAIIDGIMPRLDGLGVLERLQKNKDGFHPVCIMLSAITQEKVIQKAMDLALLHHKNPYYHLQAALLFLSGSILSLQ